jgi:thiosulfate/3-mercaptopyruvate sulfurtransferase
MVKENGNAHSHPLVRTDWGAAHSSDPRVRLVEVDVDTTAHGSGHIPGAIGWDWTIDLQGRPVRDTPDHAEWESLLSRSGTGNDDLVVPYDDIQDWFAAFAYWLFKLYGHADVALMDGVRTKWTAGGRELTADIPLPAPTRYEAKEPNLVHRAFRDEAAAVIGRAPVALVDVRSPKERSGELLAPENLPQEGAKRGGHFPGALNIPWVTAVADDGTFRPAAELKSIYGGQGATLDRTTIAYCRIGERSAHTWSVLRELLGYPDVRNYDGSWTEWGVSIGAPIVR